MSVTPLRRSVDRCPATAPQRLATLVVVELPGIRLANPLNGSHGHWSGRARRAAEQRGLARLSVQARQGELPPMPLVVTITRIAPGTLDDDNLAASGKHVRDGIADALGVPDNDPRVSWRVAQERSKRGVWGVTIRIEARSQADER